MQFKMNSLFFSAFFLLFVSKACHAELSCYVCEDCSDVTKQTPTQLCNADYFNAGDTTLAPTTDSTSSTQILTSTSETSSTIPSTTVVTTTETTESTTTTTGIPVPPTIAPPTTTTPGPTPPNEGTIPTPQQDDIVRVQQPAVISTDGPSSSNTETNGTLTDNDSNGNSTTTTLLNVRQRRETASTTASYDYYCYRVKKQVNATTTVQERGCSRVAVVSGSRGVCNQLVLENVGIKTSKCYVCTSSRCNGSSTIGISVLSIIVGVLATLLKRN